MTSRSVVPSSSARVVDLENAPLSGSVWASIGALSGVIEVCVNQPTVSWKNAAQQKQPLSFKPAVMYRGLTVNALSIAPITAVQFGVAGMLTQRIKDAAKSQSHELSSSEKIGVSLAGGAVSSLIVCPADMLIIQQQKTGLSLVAQCRTIVSQFGILKFTRGQPLATCRESLFTAGYMGLPPVLRGLLVESAPLMFASQPPATIATATTTTSQPNSLHKSQHSATVKAPISLVSTKKKDEGNVASLFASNLLAGMFAGFITHPIDTMKTRMQGDIANNSIYTSSLKTAQIIYSEGGITQFFKGVMPRTGRICIAVLIFQYCNKQFAIQARKLGLSSDSDNSTKIQ